jgi:hypothetical protein
VPPTEVADLPPDEAAVRAQIAAVTVTILPGLESASPPIQRLAHRHKAIPAKEIAWARQADRQGPILEVQVSDAQASRALLIADAILRTAEWLGWPFEAVKPKDTGYQRRPVDPPNPTPIGALMVAGEPFAIRIDEPQKRTDHVATADEVRRQKKDAWFHPPPWDFNWSGDLRLHAHEPDSRSVDRTWKDGKRRRLEDKIRDILNGLYYLALRAKARRAEHERWARERCERERLERERSQRRDVELKLIHKLECQAGAWFRLRLLHRYIRAARRALGEQHIEAKRGDKTVDFFDWAQDYVDQLDPLHPAARNDDLLESPFTFHADAGLKKGFARLAGFEGQRSCKVAGGVDAPLPLTMRARILTSDRARGSAGLRVLLSSHEKVSGQRDKAAAGTVRSGLYVIRYLRIIRRSRPYSSSCRLSSGNALITSMTTAFSTFSRP